MVHCCVIYICYSYISKQNVYKLEDSCVPCLRKGSCYYEISLLIHKNIIMDIPGHIRKISTDDRCTVFASDEFIALGDGQTLPYRQFIEKAIFDIARPYFLSPESNITAIDPRKLSGLIGAMLARQSRAPGTVIDVLVEEFLVTTQEEATELGVDIGSLREGKLDKLIERILIQYGDDSVQELETATVLFNSVSNLATKMIEDRRLGAFIEQSSRYVLYTQKDPVTDSWYYYRDPMILNSRLGERYVSVLDRCFELYSKLIDKLQDYYKTLKPIDSAQYAIKPNDEAKYRFDELNDDKQRRMFERSYTFDIRTRACDTARIMLPAATLTNVAMVANGRTFEHLLKRMYSSNHPEFKDIACRLHATLNCVIPKYVKRAEPDGSIFWMNTDKDIKNDIRSFIAQALVCGGVTEEVKLHDIPRLISGEPRALNHLLAAVYYQYARTDYETLVRIISELPDQTVRQMFARAVGNRSVRRDRSPRGFEHGYDITAEIVSDFGVFRDLHRHRMAMLLWQRPNPHLGFVISEDIETIGMAGDCRALETEVRALYNDIERELSPELAEYVVLFGHKIRFMFGMNLRETQHLLEIRTVVQGHPNYRRVCQKIHNEICVRAPWIEEAGLFKFVDHNDYHWARSEAEARQSQKLMERGLDAE